jgi:hypothetical protein
MTISDAMIKALEWRPVEPYDFCKARWFAIHAYGGYHIEERDTNGMGRIRYFTIPVKALTEYLTFDEAVASVQADYEQRIRSALSTSQSGPSHINPELEPGEYVVTIATKGGAVQINGQVNPAPEVAALRAENERLRDALRKIIRQDDTGPMVYKPSRNGPSQAIGGSKGKFAAIARTALDEREGRVDGD